MATVPVQIIYFTGLKSNFFENVRLTGSWNENGYYSDEWISVPMQQTWSEDGCPCFQTTIELDESQIGRQFNWGIVLDAPLGKNLWGIPTEVKDINSSARYQTFTLKNSSETQLQVEKYYLTHCRLLGSQKYYPSEGSNPGIRFSVWAPNARSVEVVFGEESGYIADDGSGINSSMGEFAMTRRQHGVWQTDERDPNLADFWKFDRQPYMFRVTKDDGQVAYRTDLYSRCQIGKGNTNPQGQPYIDSAKDLDGTKSCSVVVNLDTVSKHFQELNLSEQEFIAEEEFWQNEFTPGKPVPSKVEELVIYELHLGALGYGKDRPGNFEDAMQLLDYFEDLGVNAIELLPLAEFRDEANWGYETSHYFALEYSAGGRDQLKHFVRECHRRGIAVILDVVYNHYSPDGERAQWAYDSNAFEKNIYYWYEGNSNNYFYSDGRPFPEGGYIDNMSTGFAPRFHEEMVRKMFISSAVTLATEFHVDGFRVDQTTSMHSYNVLHADGSSMGNANIFGAKFLSEWSRTLKLIKPSVMLMAEDHSEWDRVTKSSFDDGLGFNAAWYSNFYHHLVGDTERGSSYAELIRIAGLGQDGSLPMDYFAGVLAASSNNKVVYHESHDEAGNSTNSRRTIMAAVNSAPLIGETRRVAEARCRFACGVTMLSAGTPMFLMGEEIGAHKPYRYEDFLKNKEDLLGERETDGQRLFKFYQNIIQLRRSHSGLRSHNIDLIHVHNDNRVIAFRRWDETQEFLIVASLNNYSFSEGYVIENSRLQDGSWREIFNSDAESYGGYNVGNSGAAIQACNSNISIIIPANGFVVFQKVR